jgi:predicted RNA-binding Zn ribbon-like protein
VTSGRLAFELAATSRHDGHGGTADALDTVDGLDAWVTAHDDELTEVLGGPIDSFAADEHVLMRVVEVRRAVRSLFARAVSPAPPSRADANRLLDPDTAIARLNAAADDLAGPRLDWPAEGPPVTRWEARTADPAGRLVAALGRSGIDFLAGPDRERLRACPAARCVKYFLQDDPRQTWCSPRCGNRERVNRYYRKHHGAD